VAVVPRPTQTIQIALSVKFCATSESLRPYVKLRGDSQKFALQKMALNLRKTAKKVRGKTKKFAILNVQTARHIQLAKVST
jgi:hypothetical protein